MKYKKYTVSALAAIVFTTLLGTGTLWAADTPAAVAKIAVPAVKATAPVVKEYSLQLDTNTYTSKTAKVNGQNITYRAFENRVYVQKPVDVLYQTINIYVPEAYYHDQSINGYTAKTAPVFLPNTVGGYMPGAAGTPGEDRRRGGPDAALTALSRGLVVAEPGARGRTLMNAKGEYTGKAPALIVDVKAAIRYLRYNKDRIPGDTEKIISNGTSAGGALSALIGATGNSKDYVPYLQALGAATERDDIFASMNYCPITNLNHADMAYEWVFSGVNDFHQRQLSGMMPAFLNIHGKIIPLGPGPVILNPNKNQQKVNRPDNAPADTTDAVPMSVTQIMASKQLKALFPTYVNSLGLKDKNGVSLTLDAQGNGTFKDYIKSIYMASAQKAVDSGIDLSKLSWLTIKNGKVTDMDLGKYAVYATRLKATPAFDSFDLSSGENDEFGTINVKAKHFTAYSQAHSTIKTVPLADAKTVKLLNPMDYIGQAGSTVAPHWRIRHGAVDRDTAMPIPAILALKLMNSGYDVDFASPWGYGHDGDYDLPELFDWIDKICKK